MHYQFIVLIAGLLFIFLYFCNSIFALFDILCIISYVLNHRPIALLIRYVTLFDCIIFHLGLNENSLI